MPAEALRRTQASLAYFDRLEVWHAVGMADPWLVGGVRLPSRRERVYLLYDWGTETTAGRGDLPGRPWGGRNLMAHAPGPCGLPSIGVILRVVLLPAGGRWALL